MSHDRILACRAAQPIAMLVWCAMTVTSTSMINKMRACRCAECANRQSLLSRPLVKRQCGSTVTVPVCVWTPGKLIAALGIVDSLMHGGDDGAIGSLKDCTACKQLLSHNDGVGTLVWPHPEAPHHSIQRICDAFVDMNCLNLLQE